MIQMDCATYIYGLTIIDDMAQMTITIHGMQFSFVILVWLFSGDDFSPEFLLNLRRK